MISVDQLSIDFGDFQLFNNISFIVNSKGRIGFVGKNGAGKSTLLKVFVKLQISYPHSTYSMEKYNEKNNS